MINKSELLEEFNYMGNYIFKRLECITKKNINDFDMDNTVLVIVDMNNGFAKYGNLYSKRIENLIKPIVRLANKMSEKNARIICFSDSHSQDSIEFLTYPRHCLTNTDESQVIKELTGIEGVEIVIKNSTNGFFAEDFQLNFDKDNFIIVGNCTDICLYQFAITLKSYFNQINENKRIIIPMNLVDTFETENHKANFMNFVFLNSMLDNGLDVIKLNLNY